MTNKYTNNIKTNETVAKTIINRLGQKSISLPRISDDKRLRGYPGLAGTARKISKYIPICKYYIEPFAGTAKVYQELSFKPNFVFLNDKSEFVFNWLNKEFKNINIWKFDFKDCMNKFIKMKDAFYLIDIPWHKEIYLQSYSCFDRESVKDYDDEVLELCKKIKGKFIICSDRKNPRMLKSEFNNKLIEGNYKVAGGNVKTLLTSNIDFKIYN